MARNDELQSLSEVLKSFVNENRLQKGLDKVNVKDIWQQQMGPAINKYTSSIQLNNDTLYVSLSSSVLREELSYGKEKIIKMMNEELGKELVKKLVFR
ncbi:MULTISPECIES: DUF721 domain-containing protein [Mesonia]|uniref:Uncharacterized protein n=1 Tax=Mesonia oceanica TaxID=2687242 RepID=A0AC61YBL7_9FLAO|nr:MULTISPECIES: DUF721 domain-containing protein [Mesonia]MAN29105.1 RNA-binding protein [Mesonia sp.]MAQ41829.1 RNA-binding protein [Mesonia sp.]MBJ98337.1 RNA-binding protein [Flavobacteriaceae bacterium]VVV01773.1 hypothetical protein FVB9532_03067 [Mesonia oceanica]|tara:strand:+ start:60 stop:353 length:294 start_codon:yes stop_codon:yes gene_type:complete